MGKVASRFAKVTCFIVPLAIRVPRIPNTIGKVPPLGAKVTCFLGPLAALPGSGRPGVAWAARASFGAPERLQFLETQPAAPKPRKQCYFPTARKVRVHEKKP